MSELEYDSSIDPFAGMATVATSVPQVDAVYVSQPTEPAHKVVCAVTVKHGRAEFFVWDCACGYHSALHPSAALANKAYLEHKEQSG